MCQEATQHETNIMVGKVEASLKAKLSQLQGLAQALQQALHAVATEGAGITRSQRRVQNMLKHLNQQLGLNQARQKVSLNVVLST
jgi:hypothetical protein